MEVSSYGSTKKQVKKSLPKRSINKYIYLFPGKLFGGGDVSVVAMVVVVVGEES